VKWPSDGYYVTVQVEEVSPAAPRCAFDRCQAGGVILEGAPRFQRVGLVTGVQLSTYHPGCWAALQRRADAR
jgi:hypothetical protein